MKLPASHDCALNTTSAHLLIFLPWIPDPHVLITVFHNIMIKRMLTPVKRVSKRLDQPVEGYEGLSSPWVHDFFNREVVSSWEQLYNTM